MRYWSEHPELYDKIITEEMVRRGFASKNERFDAVLKRWKKRLDMAKIARKAEANYWADKAEEVKRND